MDNKLSELSKPVDFLKSATLIAARNFERWSKLAALTSESSSVLHSSTLLETSQLLSALLAELEAKDKRIAELEVGENIWESATLKHLARAEAAEKQLVYSKDAIATLERKAISSFDECAKMSQRIEELEDKLATPVRLLGEMIVHDWEHRVDRQAAFEHRKIAWDARLAEDKKAILAAGFTFTVEGDE